MVSISSIYAIPAGGGVSVQNPHKLSSCNSAIPISIFSSRRRNAAFLTNLHGNHSKAISFTVKSQYMTPPEQNQQKQRFSSSDSPSPAQPGEWNLASLFLLFSCSFVQDCDFRMWVLLGEAPFPVLVSNFVYLLDIYWNKKTILKWTIYLQCLMNLLSCISSGVRAQWTLEAIIFIYLCNRAIASKGLCGVLYI